jgi:hypothetical protein
VSGEALEQLLVLARPVLVASLRHQIVELLFALVDPFQQDALAIGGSGGGGGCRQSGAIWLCPAPHAKSGRGKILAKDSPAPVSPNRGTPKYWGRICPSQFHQRVGAQTRVGTRIFDVAEIG